MSEDEKNIKIISTFDDLRKMTVTGEEERVVIIRKPAPFYKLTHILVNLTKRNK